MIPQLNSPELACDSTPQVLNIKGKQKKRIPTEFFGMPYRVRYMRDNMNMRLYKNLYKK